MKDLQQFSQEQKRENLRLLADYFESANLRAGFDMEYLTEEKLSVAVHPELNNRTDCGAVGCALGHAAFLIPKGEGEHWMNFACRCFVSYDRQDFEFDWLFSAHWKNVDNTPEGVAARIRYMLAHGVPLDPEAFYLQGRRLPYLSMLPKSHPLRNRKSC